MTLSNSILSEEFNLQEKASPLFLTVQAKPNDLGSIYDFINNCLDVSDCSIRLRMQLIFSAEDILEYIVKLAKPFYEDYISLEFHFLQALGVIELSFIYQDYQKKLYYLIS